MKNWFFRETEPGDPNREPIHGEFFASDAVSDPGKALVREGIQNSLDAIHSRDEPVLVRIFLSGVNRSLPPEKHEVFFDKAWPHYLAKRNGLSPDSRPQPETPCPYIVFEDWNTDGLTGDVSDFVQPAPGIENHFYHFFRAEGQSDKGAKKRGSWGVGKTVFLRASQVSSVLGMTVRSDDKLRLLMGKSVLRSHRVEDVPYQDGYLGVPPEEGRGLVMPIDDPAYIEEFAKSFGLQRGKEESGLSLVIPWYDPEINENEIIKAVVLDYFYPILDGQLQVIIETPSVKEWLEKDSLQEFVGGLDPAISAELNPLIDLALWALRVEDTDRVVLNCPPANRAWRWEKDLIPEESFDSLRTALSEKGRQAVRVPVVVKKKSGEERESYFDIFFERSFDEQKGRPTFIREGIIISAIKCSRTNGIRAIVVAGDEGIAEFLRDAENPSHTVWDHSRLKDKYRHGCKRDLEFVMNSVYELIRILTTQEQEEDKHLLADVFSIQAPPEDPEADPEPRPRPSPEPGDRPGDPPPPPPPPRPKRFKLTRRDGGFSVSKGDDGAMPSTLDIRVAYDIRRGNPLKRYNEADFDLGKEPILLQPDPTGIEILEREGNRIKAKITDPDFGLHVVGFDHRRQLYVRVTASGVDDGNS